ncbi:bifunctional hydroxymethylpyrimidine kinase/phosphomethylpyrimidine kinase [Nakamurella flava]|uniref:Bifunctional hydroxymethylpyrimidine kinase/phosphomethylpyrimidine kinase n=1 Tax=Nakamurella flava TaxID=2576308 RepID=A0A4U6QFA1_9ACTN|nr:bifunctional hydroxymethylpyrimidine kinase/phosphomethylpyrimidine kinase [Nakamurella flava]TKV58761.1 bifunctional hydroxymethylpyrimidine kinase/phosphomethylpyrimidine kinase [Nakamurella flava]
MVATIAGSDPSGGAGIQADLKTLSALGAYGCAVLTALTAQNTRGVTGVHAVPADFVRAQFDTLVADVELDAIKIGMVADGAIAAAIADGLAELAAGGSGAVVVLDPVMIATSGDRLLAADAEDVVRRRLVPAADLITPNVDEAAALLGVDRATTIDDLRTQALALRGLGARRVLLKGGHLAHPGGPTGDRSIDVLVDADGTVHEIGGERIDTVNTHGTGCTLSSAIAALRPVSPDWVIAVRRAKDYLTRALRHADDLQIGRPDTDGRSPGHGPVHHFAEVWPPAGAHRSR